jgi:hypothetical protein
MTWNFARPDSGARRATWATNNTLNVSRAFLGAPDGLELCKAGFGGTPCYLDDKQHAARAGLGAPDGLELCKAGFRGNGWFVGNV